MNHGYLVKQVRQCIQCQKNHEKNQYNNHCLFVFKLAKDTWITATFLTREKGIFHAVNRECWSLRKKPLHNITLRGEGFLFQGLQNSAKKDADMAKIQFWQWMHENLCMNNRSSANRVFAPLAKLPKCDRNCCLLFMYPFLPYLY